MTLDTSDFQLFPLVAMFLAFRREAGGCGGGGVGNADPQCGNPGVLGGMVASILGSAWLHGRRRWIQIR